MSPCEGYRGREKWGWRGREEEEEKVGIKRKRKKLTAKFHKDSSGTKLIKLGEKFRSKNFN